MHRAGTALQLTQVCSSACCAMLRSVSISYSDVAVLTDANADMMQLLSSLLYTQHCECPLAATAAAYDME
jgi:hypothetical protein|eukprot:10559-Heterococcus_DN1.PRE.3